MGVEVSHLAKRYGQRTVIKDLSFSVPDNALLAIWGPNGAGKTTLLRMMATLERPTSGVIHLDGCDTVRNADEARGLIGVVGHNTMLYPDLTLLENIELFGRLYHVENPRQRALELIELVGLQKRRYDAVKTFSRGMSQRACLARALVHHPRYLLLDEPYTGLDVAAVQTLDRIVMAEDAAYTRIIVTHDLERVLRHADYIAILRGPAAAPIFITRAGHDDSELRTLLGEAVSAHV